MDENENIIEENLEKEPEGQDQDEKQPGKLQESIHLSGMYENWFLDYASYVILERAVPEVSDGLKPVHRRILHAMKDLDDGRYNKVANIIGHTMKYHPHGDTSIGDALVQLGQKDLLIDAQGNWGNILTGDSAAAPRYIEARLSKFALEVLFNFKTTEWKQSYDGRNKEPVALPVKFPLLLAQGVEGIAVGLASKILPHNFNELIDASINILKDKDFEIYPDFPTGGLIDVSKYQGGLRGGKVRVRARIRKLDKKNLVITEMPFGITTSNLIESIVSANDKRKIRIRKIAKWALWGLAVVVVLFGLYLSVFFFPYPLFPHHIEHAGFNVYSDREIPEGFEVVLADARRRVEAMEQLGDEQVEVQISYAVETTGFELPQLLNVLFGNSSLQHGIRLMDLDLPDVLLTGTPDFIAAPLARLVRADGWRGARYAVRGGVFQAALPVEHPLGLDKIRAAMALCEEAGSSLRDAMAYADSSHDLPLLLGVRHPVVVRPDDKLRAEAKARGWEIMGATAPDSDPRIPQGRATHA